MKIFVTGGSGFIGKHLIEKLQNEHELIIYENFSNSSEKDFSNLFKNNVSLIKGDMTNFESVNHFMNQEFDVILHLASVIPKYDENGIPIKQSFSSNVIGTENIAKSASKFGI